MNCCGAYKCTSECKARIYHGPGHQSTTHCELKEKHKNHHAVYGSQQQIAEWRGLEVFSGFFDEAPYVDE